MEEEITSYKKLNKENHNSTGNSFILYFINVELYYFFKYNITFTWTKTEGFFTWTIVSSKFKMYNVGDHRKKRKCSKDRIVDPSLWTIVDSGNESLNNELEYILTWRIMSTRMI